MKNVKELDITDFMDMEAERDRIAKDHGWIEVFDEAVVSLQSPSANHFAHLKSLTILSGSGGLGIMDVISLFKLPSVEKLELRSFTRPSPMAHWDIPKSSCNANDLRLEECFIHDTSLEQILGSFKALKTFAYDQCATRIRPSTDSSDPTSQKVDTSWTKILKALYEYRDSLESFHPSCIDAIRSRCGKQMVSQRPTAGYSPSLKGFNKLGKIAVALEMLLDLDAKETDLGDKLPSGV